MIDNDQIGEIEQIAIKLHMQADVLTNLWFDVQRLTRALTDVGTTMREAAETIQQLLKVVQQDEKLIAQFETEKEKHEDDLK